MFGELDKQFSNLNLEDEDAKDAAVIANVPSNSWFEGFAMRPNGDALASRLDGPELYTYSSASPQEELKLVHTFDTAEATGVINICALLGTPDEYAVITGFVNITEVKFENFIIWRVKLDAKNEKPPVVTKMGTMPEAGFCIGLIPATERTLLIADSSKACIWRFDIATARADVLHDDPLMEAASEDDFFGLNRLRVAGGYVWFTNSSAGLLGRLPVAIKSASEVADGEWDIEVTDGVDVIVADIPNCDGLALNEDQSAAYVNSYIKGWLMKVDIKKRETSVIMNNLITPTSIEMAKTLQGHARLYVICCGQVENGWANDGIRSTWSDLADINAAVSVEVTVTEDAA